MATTTPAGVRAHAKHGGGSSEHAQMTHRQIMEALSGLMLGMFVAILSSTIVTNALPHIISDLGGGQSAYTWVVTASLLAMTATTPLWGKLADLFSKKALVQIALIVYVLGSMAAGLSQNPGMLIACRVFQGIGVGPCGPSSTNARNIWVLPAGSWLPWGPWGLAMAADPSESAGVAQVGGLSPGQPSPPAYLRSQYLPLPSF